MVINRSERLVSVIAQIAQNLDTIFITIVIPVAIIIIDEIAVLLSKASVALLLQLQSQFPILMSL